MRIFVDRHNRRLFLTVAAVLIIYAILIQFLCGAFSLPVLIISAVSSFAVLMLCILFFKKQDSIIENAAQNVKNFLSGNKDERIECNEEGELFYLFQTVNIVNSISMSVSARIKQYGAMRAVGMSKKQIGSMIKSETLTYASLGCGTGLLFGLLFSKWLYGFLVTSHYAYSVWELPVAEIAVIIAFFILSVAAGIKAPVKRLNEMSVTETIGQL